MVALKNKINTEKLLTEIENRLTDVNTGSYEDGDCADDFFMDAENIHEVKEHVSKYCDEFSKDKLDIEELYNKILDVEVIWDTSPQDNYYSFKERFEKLKDTLTCWKIDDLKRYIEEE